MMTVFVFLYPYIKWICDIITINSYNMSDSLFDLVPNELCFTILNYTNTPDLFTLLKLFSKYVNDNFLPLAQKRIAYQTGLRTNSFDIERLQKLSIVRFGRNISAIMYPLIITTNNIHCCGIPDDIDRSENESSDLSIEKYNFLDRYAGQITQIQSFDLGSEYDNNETFLFLTSDGQVYKSEEDFLSLESNGKLYTKCEKTHINITPKSETIVSISAFEYSALLLSSTGNVYGYGAPLYENMGYEDIIFPELLPELKDIIQVSIGYSNGLALCSNGTVYSFSQNARTRMGALIFDGSPKIIPNLYDIVQISCGYEHSLLLDIKGDVYGFGRNSYGQLGSIISYHVDQPIYITNNIISISAKGHYSLLLSKDGSIYVCGDNDNNQLGIGNNIQKTSLTQITSLKNIIQISTHSNYSLALDNNGTVYMFGDCCYDLHRDIPEPIYQITDMFFH